MISQEKHALSKLIQQVKDIFHQPPRGHLFRTSMCDYFYDTNTGEIIACDPVSIDIIRYLGKPKLEASVWELARKHGQDIVCEHLNQLLALSVNHSPPLFSIDAPETACYNTNGLK